MKLRNNGSPEIPLITMLNNDKCPCLRKGCICTTSQKHQFHQGLLTVEHCWDKECTMHRITKTTLSDMGQEISNLRNEIQQLTERLKSSCTIRSVSGNAQTRQMETTIEATRLGTVRLGQSVFILPRAGGGSATALIQTHPRIGLPRTRPCYYFDVS